MIATLALVPILFVAASFLRNAPRRASLVAVALATPLFIKFTGTSVELGDAIHPRGVGQTFPIGLPAIVFFGGLLVLLTLRRRLRWRVSALAVPVLAFITVNFFALLLGLVEHSAIENVLFFLQTVVPTLAFFIALRVVREQDNALKATLAYVAVISAFVVGLLISSLQTKGLAGTVLTGMVGHLWIFPIYSLFDYVPLVVAVAYGLALAVVWGRAVDGRVALFFTFMAVVMFASLFFFHSRGALLTALAITLLEGFLFKGHWRRHVLTPLSFLVLAVVAALLVRGQSFTMQAWMGFAEARSEETSLQTRLITFSTALNDIARHPLAGLRYVPQLEDLSTLRRIAYPHNQYLTYAVRAGLICLVIFVWTAVLFARRLYAVYRQPATPTLRALGAGLLSVFLGVLFVSNFLQDNFTQPFTALGLWFFMGVGEAVFLVNRRLKAAAASHYGGSLQGVG